jgi:hypothetical protein
MGANKLEAFEIVTMHRSKIQKADYNPRRITESAQKKLRKFLKENGLWQPLIVNKETMNLVSGHQRITIMDSLMRTDDYELTVSLVNVDEKTEVAGNIFMNNQSAMGEWDNVKLEDIHNLFPEIDFVQDLAFDISEVDFILGESYKPNKTEEEGEFEEKVQESKIGKIKELEKQSDQKERERIASGDSYEMSDADYSVTFVFPNNHEKREFMKKVNKKETEKYLKSTVLFDIFNKVYNLSVLRDE